MSEKTRENKAPATSRRRFLQASATAAIGGGLASQVNIARSAHVAGDETIKIGFIGCGGRGTGACRDALGTKGPVKLVAMGDLFADRMERSLKRLREIKEIRDRVDVKDDMKFIGFDAYQKILDLDVDLVLLTTPPHFRPEHYAAAVKAGKNIFMEKPCCVDAPGFRTLMAANQVAQEKKLSVVVGLQRHHQRSYQAAIEKLRDGAVGDVQYIRTYFNMPGGGRNDRGKPDGMTEMEYQIRRWGVFCWLSGDHIVEQAVHEIDIANWVMDSHPIRANGMGGRQVRTGKGNGDIWDHHFVEYEFEGGVRHYAQARQIAGCWMHVSDNVHGSKDTMILGSGPYGMQGSGRGIDQASRGYDRKKVRENPYQQEHDDLAASIRGSGPHLFEGGYAATSSMTAVLGRMATYSGKVVTWEEAVNSELKLAPERYALDVNPPAMPGPDGNYPVAMPGSTKAF